MKLSLIAAVAKNGVIGNHNALPWYIPEDLKHFKNETVGKVVLMGKKTFDSVVDRIKKPLPDRTNVVITRQMDWKAPEGVLVYHSIETALEALKDKDEVMVAGGGQIFDQLMDKADKLILTEVHKAVEGDVLFPKVDKNIWKEVSREDHEEFSFVEYKRS
ncbi:MAG: dihydrofolate reductase [Candidatus Doudnabacteria bacterium]|nr:dihydrofolate reductase [Candidatus Doudnabacteria bacterium]